MIRNALIGLATVAAAAAALSAPASANGYGNSYSTYSEPSRTSDYDDYRPTCHTERQKVFIGYGDYGRKIFVWKRVRVCH